MQVHLAVAEGRGTLVGRNPKSDKAASPSEDPARATFGDVPNPPLNPSDPGRVIMGPTLHVNPEVVVGPVTLPPFPGTPPSRLGFVASPVPEGILGVPKS